MIARASFAMLTLVALASYKPAESQRTEGFNGFALVDKAGNIQKPTNYRDHYQVLGTYAVLDPKGNQMHFTYASPGAAEYYRKNGKFADGTVLVKEVLGTDHAQMTTGDAHWASGTKVWFVMIKDEKGRYLGMGVVQVRRARQTGRHGLQERLPGLPHPRTDDGLGVRPRLSSSRLKVSSTMRRELIFENAPKEMM